MSHHTAIDRYNADKAERDRCRAWAGLIGSKYHGGGGGIGKLTSIRLASGEALPTVYHQYNDGAKNYHAMPEGLRFHLEEAIKARFSELLADALSRQDAALKVSAEHAVKEHAEMLAAAGLTA